MRLEFERIVDGEVRAAHVRPRGPGRVGPCPGSAAPSWAPRSAAGASGGRPACGREEARYVTIATGSVTGTYYPVGSLIANLLSRPPGARACDEAGGCGVPNLILVVEASKGSVANVEAIAAGRVETGFAQSDVTHGAFSGTGVFAGQPPMTGLRALASLYLESVHLAGRPRIPASPRSPTCAASASRSTSRARARWSTRC